MAGTEHRGPCGVGRPGEAATARARGGSGRGGPAPGRGAPIVRCGQRRGRPWCLVSCRPPPTWECRCRATEVHGADARVTRPRRPGRRRLGSGGAASRCGRWLAARPVIRADAPGSPAAPSPRTGATHQREGCLLSARRQLYDVASAVRVSRQYRAQAVTAHRDQRRNGGGGGQRGGGSGEAEGAGAGGRRGAGGANRPGGSSRRRPWPGGGARRG